MAMNCKIPCITFTKERKQIRATRRMKKIINPILGGVFESCSGAGRGFLSPSHKKKTSHDLIKMKLGR